MIIKPIYLVDLTVSTTILYAFTVEKYQIYKLAARYGVPKYVFEYVYFKFL